MRRPGIPTSTMSSMSAATTGRPGQPVELTAKALPGQIHAGKVVAVLQALSTGQVETSGSGVVPRVLPAPPSQCG